MRGNTTRRAWVDLLSKRKHVKISLAVRGCLDNSAIYLYNIMFSIYYIASESNQVCLYLPYILNTTKSRCTLNENTMNGFPFCCGRRCSGLDDVMTSARTCTGTTFVLIVLIRNVCCHQPALKGEGRFASWVILIGCAKTDEPITGNITGSFCIFSTSESSMTQLPSYCTID